MFSFVIATSFSYNIVLIRIYQEEAASSDSFLLLLSYILYIFQLLVTEAAVCVCEVKALSTILGTSAALDISALFFFSAARGNRRPNIR